MGMIEAIKELAVCVRAEVKGVDDNAIIEDTQEYALIENFVNALLNLNTTDPVQEKDSDTATEDAENQDEDLDTSDDEEDAGDEYSDDDPDEDDDEVFDDLDDFIPEPITIEELFAIASKGFDMKGKIMILPVKTTRGTVYLMKMDRSIRYYPERITKRSGFAATRAWVRPVYDKYGCLDNEFIEPVTGSDRDYVISRDYILVAPFVSSFNKDDRFVVTDTNSLSCGTVAEKNNVTDIVNALKFLDTAKNKFIA